MASGSGGGNGRRPLTLAVVVFRHRRAPGVNQHGGPER